MRRGTAGLLAAFAAVYFVWGSTYLAIRVGLETLPPFALAGVRFVTAGLALYAVVRLRGAAAPTRSQWRDALILGVLMMVTGNGLVTWAELHVASGLAAVLVATVPLWVAGVGASFFSTPRIEPRVWVGLACGFIGVIVLVRPAADAQAVHPWGSAALLVASLSWAVGSLLAPRRDQPKSPWLSAAMQMIAGGAVLLVAATLHGEWSAVDPARVSLRSAVALAYLVTFGSIVALSAYVWLLRQVSVAAVSTYAFVNPVVAVFLGWALGNEPVGARLLVASVLIVGALVLVHSALRRAAPPTPDARRRGRWPFTRPLFARRYES